MGMFLNWGARPLVEREKFARWERLWQRHIVKKFKCIAFIIRKLIVISL